MRWPRKGSKREAVVQEYSVYPCRKTRGSYKSADAKKAASGDVTHCNICCLSLRREYCFRQGRNHFKQIAHHAIVGDLKDGRVLVLVDGDHCLRALHPHEMLNRPRDADRKIELRRYRLA